MSEIVLGKIFAQELQNEEKATLHCLDSIPMELAHWKPHEKSMELGYVALLVAEIPKWINITMGKGEIDFMTYSHFVPKTTAELVGYFRKNQGQALQLLDDVSDESLREPFFLKDDGQVLLSLSKKENIMSSINHMIHHQGKLTVYMRLNDIAVPSMYGPSAGYKNF